MATYFDQNCPLCKSSAEYRFNDGNNYKVFHCDVCRVFAISVTAEKRLEKHSTSWAKGMSEKSRRLSVDKLLRISAGIPGSSEPFQISDDLRSNWKT